MNPSDRVDTVEQARAAMTEVCHVLRRRGGVDLGDGEWIGLTLQTEEVLRREVASPYCRSPRGSATHSWSQVGGGTVKTDYRIAILRGLSRTDFSACCAHELGHIYQYRAHFPDLPVLVSEGLCELFKFTWYAAQGAESALEALRRLWANPDPVYGAGFRFAYPALLGRTLVGVMEHVGQHGHLPPPAMGGATHE